MFEEWEVSNVTIRVAFTITQMEEEEAKVAREEQKKPLTGTDVRQGIALGLQKTTEVVQSDEFNKYAGKVPIQGADKFKKAVLKTVNSDAFQKGTELLAVSGSLEDALRQEAEQQAAGLIGNSAAAKAAFAQLQELSKNESLQEVQGQAPQLDDLMKLAGIDNSDRIEKQKEPAGDLTEQQMEMIASTASSQIKVPTISTLPSLAYEPYQTEIQQL